MRTFICDHCGHLVFFENTLCEHCGSALAFVPELMRMAALQPSPLRDLTWDPVSQPLAHSLPHVRMCRNREHVGAACNFTTDADGSQPYCVSCRQTRWLPNLGNPINLLRTSKIENAKRYLFYTLSCLQLTILNGRPAPIFDFLEDIEGHPPVMTGHFNGVITLNVAEADDDERARRRLAMFEPYRTLLGHLRHESGHFYWDVLIRDSQWLTPYRVLFGDERQDYGQALRDHYALGPQGPANWRAQHVSAYAAAHPWEDWAETWAHYLHLMDLMETAASYKVQLRLPGHMASWPPMDDPFADASMPFQHILHQCVPLTLMLNSLTRSMGQLDAYPFALSTGAVAKLQFIHDVVTEHRLQNPKLEVH
jgi:hypothetical protein